MKDYKLWGEFFNIIFLIYISENNVAIKIFLLVLLNWSLVTIVVKIISGSESINFNKFLIEIVKIMILVFAVGSIIFIFTVFNSNKIDLVQYSCRNSAGLLNKAIIAKDECKCESLVKRIYLTY